MPKRAPAPSRTRSRDAKSTRRVLCERACAAGVSSTAALRAPRFSLSRATARTSDIFFSRTIFCRSFFRVLKGATIAEAMPSLSCADSFRPATLSGGGACAASGAFAGCSSGRSGGCVFSPRAARGGVLAGGGGRGGGGGGARGGVVPISRRRGPDDRLLDDAGFFYGRIWRRGFRGRRARVFRSSGGAGR